MTVLPVRATITPLGGSGKGAGIDFHGWKGWIGELEDDLDFARRPGASGNALQTLGKELIRTCQAWRQEVNATSAAAWIAALQSAKGPAVSIKDPYNRTLKRCRIRSIDFDTKHGRGGQLSGGNATICIMVSLLVERLPDG